MTKQAALTDAEVLLDHVSDNGNYSGGYYPTFILALREARWLTNRDDRTGVWTGVKPVALWSGTIAYLLLLEQIGNTLRPVGGRRLKTKEFPPETAIRLFARTAATRNQRQILYALRCAFAHEFGIYNSRGRGPYKRLFSLTDDPIGPLVIPPRRRFGGSPAQASRMTSTTVNLVRVGDLAEEVVKSVRDHAAAGTLRSRMPLMDLRKQFGVGIS